MRNLEFNFVAAMKDAQEAFTVWKEESFIPEMGEDEEVDRDYIVEVYADILAEHISNHTGDSEEYALVEYTVAYDTKGLDLLCAEDVTNQNVVLRFKGSEDITSELREWLATTGSSAIDEDWRYRN